jgi:hypothetical protein
MPKNNLIKEPVKTITIKCDCGRYVTVEGETTCPYCGKSIFFETLLESVKEGAEILRRKNDTK